MKKTIICLLALMVATASFAQKNRTMTLINAALHGWEYELRAGISIGGTSPLPLPREIRKIDSYDPTLNILLEGNMYKWFDDNKKWGMVTGLRFENKNMETKATVKNYSMEITGYDGNHLKGNWTGGVQTTVKSTCLTIPVLAAYAITPRWNVKLGPYFSYVMKHDFSGEVYDGYLREGNPTGDKISFSGNSTASYNFKDDMRNFQWGLQAGADWRAFKHLKVFADLTWGLNDIFKKDFETISFAMYPIYLHVGFGYAF